VIHKCFDSRELPNNHLVLDFGHDNRGLSRSRFTLVPNLAGDSIEK
jgi:hypothetical protein